MSARKIFGFSLFVFFTVLNYLQAQVDSLAWSIDLEDVVVTAQFAPTSAEEAVHEVQVLKSEEWKARGLNTLSEVLQQQLNMRINPDPILGNGLSIQGIGGQNVQVMIDGVPVVGRLGGNIDLSQINLSQFERVEIITGAMSAQYGSNASGGVINLITKKHQVNAWQIEAGGQIESFGIQNQYARLGRKLGKFQIDGGINRYRAEFASVDSMRARREVTLSSGTIIEEPVIPWNPKEQFSYDVNLTFRPSDSLSILYGYRAFDEELVLYDKVRRPVFRPYSNDQFYTTERRDHHLSAEYWLSPQTYWSTTIGLNSFERFKDVRRLDFGPDTTSQVVGEQDTTKYTGTLIRSSISRLGKGRWDGQIGVEYFRETGAGGRILDIETGEVEPDLTNIAAWLNLRFKPTQRITIESNLRFGHNNRYNHPLIPAINALWRPGADWQWRLSYARGFRAPSVQDLFFNFIDVNHYIIGNPDARAEYSDNVRLHPC
ncbi:MAG: TonB-dependent receptor, partial [Bacteroidota bacterium]